MTRFPEERRRFISSPAKDALYIDLARADGAVVSAQSDEPAVRFGLRNEDFTKTDDLDRLEIILRASRTFSKTRARLRRKGVVIAREIEFLPMATGGGRTAGSKSGKSYRITIWPPAIWAGFSILDVYLHEYGHVQEDFFSWDYQQFLNAVQKELGVRATSDTHNIEPEKLPEALSGRDPFRQPGR